MVDGFMKEKVVEKHPDRLIIDIQICFSVFFIQLSLELAIYSSFFLLDSKHSCSAFITCLKFLCVSSGITSCK